MMKKGSMCILEKISNLSDGITAVDMGKLDIPPLWRYPLCYFYLPRDLMSSSSAERSQKAVRLL